MFSTVRGFLLLLLPLPLLAQAPALTPPRKIQVADGIYLFVTPPYSDVGLDGNSVVILSDQGVLVFDANGTPAAASAVLGEIRKLTPKPVRYLVYSHWHWDHWYGAEVYRKAFPGIQIISHEKTRELMMGPALAFNQPGLDTQLPEHIDYMAKLGRTRRPGNRRQTTRRRSSSTLAWTVGFWLRSGGSSTPSPTLPSPILLSSIWASARSTSSTMIAPLPPGTPFSTSPTRRS